RPVGPAREDGRALKPPSEAEPSMKQRTLAVGLVLAAATGALLLSLRDDPGPSATVPTPYGSATAEHPGPRKSRKQLPPAGPSEAALLAPLEVGGELVGWEVEFIGAVNEGRLPLVLAKDGDRLRLEIVLASRGAPEPAAATRRFHVY